MPWAKTRNPWSNDPADPNAEKNIIDGAMLAGIWGSVPASSKEFDLSERLVVDLVRQAIRSVGKSGWFVKGGFTFSAGYAPNSFRMNLSRGMVDGLAVTVVGTSLNSETEGVIQLPSPPGAGTVTDLVFLEMWLAEVPGSTLSVPVSTNKPSTAAIWKYGNVQFGGTNPADDINEVDFEIRRRVQLQYRIRTIANVDFVTYPLGINDPVVLAQGTQGSPTALQFAVHPEDPGLFVAGNGSVAHQTTLGTLDGRVLGIPIATVDRTAGVSEILAGHVWDLRLSYGVLNFVLRDGDTMTGDLNILRPTNAHFQVEATNNDQQGAFTAKGKAGATTVHGFFAANSAGVELTAFSNHPLRFATNNIVHMILSAVGNLTLSGAATKTILVESTDASTSGQVDAKGKTSGATTVHGRFIAGSSGVAMGSISNHAAWITTNDLVRFQISASGGLVAMPVGYESAQQAIVNATTITLAHGLGAIPKQVWVVLKCVTGEGGYAAGDEALVAMNGSDAGGALSYGVQLSKNATNIFVGCGGNNPTIYSRTTPGTGFTITLANWKYIVRANP